MQCRRQISWPHELKTLLLGWFLFRAACLISPILMFSILISSPSTRASPQVGTDVNDSFRQASAAMRQGNLDEAAAGFASVAQASPTFAEAHFNLALVREEQGRFDDAIASFQKALALKPHLHGANLFLGVAYFRVNQLDKAVVAIQKETATYPKNAPAWMWLGVVPLHHDKPEEAAEAPDKTAKLAPDDMELLYHRGPAHLLVSKNSYGRT